MPPAPPKQNLVERYGLQPVPENVARLTKLIAKQETDIEEIGKLIATDKAMSARLLRFANPRADSEDDYDLTTVDEALMRTGLGPVILLAMIGPLTRAVLNAFEMFATPIGAVPLQTLQPIAEEHVLATARFDGKGTGLVGLRLGPADARRIAGAVLGMPEAATVSAEEINDVIGELTNMIGGNLQSNLCDSGIECKLESPVVTQSSDFHKSSRSGAFSERLGFSGSNLVAFIDVSVNPWSE